MHKSTMFTMFRIAGLLEGTSFLVLLLIAMPLKYLANFPLPVTIVGGMHGFLFVAYVLLAAVVAFLFRWPMNRLGLAWIASVVPTGTFWFDRYAVQKQQS